MAIVVNQTDPIVQTRAARGFALLSIAFSLFLIPAQYLATRETKDVCVPLKSVPNMSLLAERNHN